MQLKPIQSNQTILDLVDSPEPVVPRLRDALTLATGSLLAATGASAQAAEATDGWQFDTTVLMYSEPDRVQALEPIVNAKKVFEDDQILNLKLTVDALTGASANGAMPSGSVQTFTRPSGRGAYTTQPGDMPLDDTFHDTRVAIAASWMQPFSSDLRGTGGINVSKEYDFLSLGANGLLEVDLFDKNSTFSVGLSLEADTIEPEGGIPTPFAAMEPAGDPIHRDGSSDDRMVVDALVGWTQVMNPNWIQTFNLSFSSSDGYHTDPFKILSVVDDNGEALGMASDGYRYEKRPDSRQKISLYWQTKHYLFGSHVLDASYRYFQDDWEMQSHTVDLKYRFPLSERGYLQPHVRLYQQSAVDFYRVALLASEEGNWPEYASADYRLGDVNGLTLGMKYGRKAFVDHEWSLRLEYYKQYGDQPDSAIGNQRNYELFPDVDAYVVQFSYAF